MTQEIEFETTTPCDERIVIYPSRVKALLFLLGSVAFIAIGVWIGALGEAGRVAHWQVIVATYIGVPFFACCGVAWLLHLVQHRPFLEFDTSGFRMTGVMGGVRLDWGEVEGVVLHDVSGQRMLSVVPCDPAVVLSRQPFLSRIGSKLNMAMGYAPISIPQVSLNMKVDVLAELLRTRYGVPVGGGAKQKRSKTRAARRHRDSAP